MEEQNLAKQRGENNSIQRGYRIWDFILEVLRNIVGLIMLYHDVHSSFVKSLIWL